MPLLKLSARDSGLSGALGVDEERPVVTDDVGFDTALGEVAEDPVAAAGLAPPACSVGTLVPPLVIPGGPVSAAGCSPPI
ncbi:hypothetical protein BCA37_26900 [Mycobacterium sp. djl-10]|nr:hypothetical protein BCA37_26900 [Mycobacterium sp. djl-10]